jgi:hypothetical protein
MKPQSETKPQQNQHVCQLICINDNSCRTGAERQLRGQWLCDEHYDEVINELSLRGVGAGGGDDLSVDIADGGELYLHDCDRYLEECPHAAADIVFYIDDASVLKVHLLCLSCAALYESDVEHFSREKSEEGQEQ